MCIERDYMTRHISLRFVARELGVSGAHLCRVLKRETGDAFLAHLHRRRIAEARRLLTQTTFSVKEIAARVGFERTSSLDSAFKRLCGVCPTSDRRERFGGY
jgi:AraC-like DNA-binding protein